MAVNKYENDLLDTMKWIRNKTVKKAAKIRSIQSEYIGQEKLEDFVSNKCN